jgi:hypothetical protein
VKTSHASNDNVENDLVRYTRQVWKPRLGRDLSSEDVRQISENVTGFFALLAKWSRAEGATAANDNNVGLSTNLIVNEEQPTLGSNRGGRRDD